MIALFALALTLQDVPIFDGSQHALDQMSADLTAHVAKCGTKATFYVPRGKKLGDAQAVIDRAATPEQIACAKREVSWLLTYDEATNAGVFK